MWSRRCISFRWSATVSIPPAEAICTAALFGLVVGLLGLLGGAQGVTQTAQQAMASVWDVPQFARTGFLPRLGRSLGGLTTIGGTFLIKALVATYVTRAGESYAIRIPALVALLVVNAVLYWLSFVIVTPKTIDARSLIPGAIAGSVAFTALITVGTGLLTHQLKDASNTYGTFGFRIGDRHGDFVVVAVEATACIRLS